MVMYSLFELVSIQFLQQLELNSEIIKRNDTQVATNSNGLGDLGIKVTELSIEAAKQLGLPSANGAVVAQVENGSKAQDAGINSGDIILEINHRKVINVDEFQKIVKSLSKGKKASFVLYRPKQGLRIANVFK